MTDVTPIKLIDAQDGKKQLSELQPGDKIDAQFLPPTQATSDTSRAPDIVEDLETPGTYYRGWSDTPNNTAGTNWIIEYLDLTGAGVTRTYPSGNKTPTSIWDDRSTYNYQAEVL